MIDPLKLRAKVKAPSLEIKLTDIRKPEAGGTLESSSPGMSRQVTVHLTQFRKIKAKR